MMIFCTCFVAWNVQRYYNFTGHRLICFTSFLRYICVVITQASIQEVRARADIVDVLGQFIRLKKRGTNYIANCPFHNEKTPSFNVSPAKGIYKCFGCGKAGDVVTFIQEHEKLTYPEAIRWLADYYKIALEETERSPEQIVQQQAVSRCAF